MHVGRISFAGTWKGTGQRRPLAGINQKPKANQVVLFTPAWGASTRPTSRTPRPSCSSRSRPPAPNTDLTAPVTSIPDGGSTAIPADGAVLVATGSAAAKLQAEAPVDTRRDGAPDPAAFVGHGGRRARRRSAARAQRQCRLPHERELRKRPTRPARRARGRRPARRRADHPRRGRRRAARLQRRHDDLRARADDGAARRRHRRRRSPTASPSPRRSTASY